MVYSMMPRGYKDTVENWLVFSGSKKTPAGFTNNAFAVSLALSFIIAWFLTEFVEYFLLAWGGVFVGLFLLFHGFLALGVDRRTKFVESILPDALQLMAANSRAGYIPSRALLLSARKEFGPLSQAIKNVGKEIATGKPLEEALREMSRHIKSETLKRTVGLIIEGGRSGGQFASLLEETAADIRRKQAIKKDVKANITMYTIFVGFAGCIGAPVLYALSSYLITTISQFGQAVEIPQIPTNMPFMKFTGIAVSESFLLLFSVAAILVTTIFGALIIGLISSGREKAGIRYIPILVVLAFAIFFIVRIVAGGMLGSIVPA